MSDFKDQDQAVFTADPAAVDISVIIETYKALLTGDNLPERVAVQTVVLQTLLDAAEATTAKPVDEAAVRKQAFEEIAYIATQQKEYWDNKQRDCKALEDTYSENGDTYTPLGNDEAWKAGYANGHFSEACWLLGTIRALSPAEPDANSHVCQSKTIGDLIHKAIDECHVNSFAAKMKDKLAIKRQQGRTGWWDMLDCELSAILRQCVDKGDPVDVANLCMMLSENGQSISPAELVEQTDLSWLNTKTNFEISHDWPEDGDESDEGVWKVHSVNGGRSDLEWTLIAEDIDLSTAIAKARKVRSAPTSTTETGE